GTDQRFFYRTPIAACASNSRNCGLVALRGNLAGPAPSPARAETRGCALHCRIWRGAHASLGNHVFGSDTFMAMNLFCVGLSHHTANVETRERFTGHGETECALRN